MKTTRVATRGALPKIRWNSLGVKLFISYLVIVAVVVIVLLQTADFVTPVGYAAQRRQMLGLGLGNPGFGKGQGGLGYQGSSNAANAEVLLNQAFQAALSQGLLVAGGVALAAAIGISFFVTWWVIRPVRRLVKASQSIAAGHYSERVPLPGKLSQRRPDELVELAITFNEMAQALEKTEQRRLELIGDVAHELRTPVSTLQGYLEGLLDGVIEPDEPTLAKLHDEAGRLRRLIDDLQELSKAEARQITLNLRQVNPLELARVAAERIADGFKEKGLKFSCDLPGNLPPVHADFDRAIQVLNNLLTNALRYTTAPGEVKLSLQAEPDAVKFKVIDSGIGLSPEQLNRVFERFYRVDKSRSRALGGSGIGLTIARMLVEAMGGRIEVSSPGLGCGTTFSFTLPFSEL